eukprot:Sro390_g132810.1 Transcriptional regulator (557) ;mRNA; f:22799-25042
MEHLVAALMGLQRPPLPPQPQQSSITQLVHQLNPEEQRALLGHIQRPARVAPPARQASALQASALQDRSELPVSQTDGASRDDGGEQSRNPGRQAEEDHQPAGTGVPEQANTGQAGHEPSPSQPQQSHPSLEQRQQTLEASQTIQQSHGATAMQEQIQMGQAQLLANIMQRSQASAVAPRAPNAAVPTNSGVPLTALTAFQQLAGLSPQLPQQARQQRGHEGTQPIQPLHRAPTMQEHIQLANILQMRQGNTLAPRVPAADVTSALASLQRIAQPSHAVSRLIAHPNAPAPVQLPTQRQGSAEAMLGNLLQNSVASNNLNSPLLSAILSQLAQPQQAQALGVAAASVPTAAAASAVPPPRPEQPQPLQQQQTAERSTQRQASHSPSPQNAAPAASAPTAGASAASAPAPGASAKRKKGKNSKKGSQRTKQQAEDEITSPGEHDVLLGRGSGASNHLGNIRYRTLVNEYKEKYISASRVDKPKVADEIVHVWRNLTPPGRFLTRCGGDDDNEGNDNEDFSGGRWVDVGNSRAKTKTCQCLREKDRPPSSKRVKKGCR